MHTHYYSFAQRGVWGTMHSCCNASPLCSMYVRVSSRNFGEGAWQFHELCSFLYCQEYFLGGKDIAWFSVSQRTCIRILSLSFSLSPPLPLSLSFPFLPFSSYKFLGRGGGKLDALEGKLPPPDETLYVVTVLVHYNPYSPCRGVLTSYNILYKYYNYPQLHSMY